MTTAPATPGAIGGPHPHAGLETVTFVKQGPFVAGSGAEIAELYRRVRRGQFTSMHDVAEAQARAAADAGSRTERSHA